MVTWVNKIKESWKIRGFNKSSMKLIKQKSCETNHPFSKILWRANFILLLY